MGDEGVGRGEGQGEAGVGGCGFSVPWGPELVGPQEGEDVWKGVGAAGLQLLGLGRSSCSLPRPG